MWRINVTCGCVGLQILDKETARHEHVHLFVRMITRGKRSVMKYWHTVNNSTNC